MPAATTGKLKILTDPAGLRAYVRFGADDGHGLLTAAEVIAALEGHKIAVTDEVLRRVEELVARLHERPDWTGEFDLAVGRPPVEGADGEFALAEEFVDRTDPDDDDGPVDFYARRSVITVEAGTPIGQVIPADPGQPGMDVFGKPLKPHKRPRAVTLGPNVRLAEDNATACAAKTGKIAYNPGRRHLDILDVVEIKGNVDFKSGNLDVHTDVLVTGTIQDLFTVRGKKSVTVGKDVEAAVVEAEGDVRVLGGVSGKDKGRIRAGGEFSARLCIEADVQARLGITIDREAMNCRLSTLGLLRIPRGTLVGGRSYAREGAELRCLGCAGEAPTELAVGNDPLVMAELAAIEAKLGPRLETVERIRLRLEPILGRLDYLPSAHRQAAVELLRQAEQFQNEIAALQRRRAGLLERVVPGLEAAVAVTQRICPGVTIVLEDRRVRFQTERKGPVRVVKKKLEGVTELVAVNPVSGHLTILPSRRFVADPPGGVE